MESKDYLTVAATLLSPFIAVFANNLVERYKERRRERIRLYETLMLNRMTPLNSDRIRALNSIDFVFCRKWNRKDENVRTKWKELHDSYTTIAPDDIRQQKWKDLNCSLLVAMAKAVGRKIDSVYVDKGAYYPQVHVDTENDLHEIRRLLKEVLSGQQPLKVDTNN